MDTLPESNELTSELLSIHSLNFATAYNPPPRGTMFAGHFSQRLVIADSEPNLNQTGNEEEFGKYTFAVKMPEDGTILQVLPRYPDTVGNDTIEFNPETTVIYQSHETGEINYFTIPYYASYHPTFGFQYETKPALNELTPHREFAKDTVFADSPAIKGESHYTFGYNLNVIQMSHPNVGLDGYVVARDKLHHFNFKMYENRSVGFGANEFPLNTYGDDSRYQAFPEIGQYVREDGLLVALRRFDPFLSPSLISRRDTREINYSFDNKIYVRPGSRGRVVDIQIIKSSNVNVQLPPEMTAQFEKYARATVRYHSDIVRFEEQQIAENKRQGGTGRIRITPKMQQLIVESKAIINYHSRETKQDITLVYRKEPLDGWLINFTIEHDVTPNRGFKLTCLNGGKGVICRVEEPENMPVDDDGNRADIITGPDSIPGRMNLGRLYGPYLAGAARDVRKQIFEEFGWDRNFNEQITVDDLKAVPSSRYDRGVATLLKYYSIVSETSYHEYTNVLTEAERWLWVANIVNTKLYNHIPIETQTRFDEMVLAIEENFKLTYSPVTYIGRSGVKVRTKNKFRVAPMYTMLLDKIADAWLSVDIGKHSNFGILAAMNNADKYSAPWRRTPPRLMGETEARLYNAVGGREMIAELMDRSGNIATQQEVARNILHADNPAQIDCVVDRDKIPLGSSRPIQIAQHLFRCAGFELVYKPEKK